MHPVTCDGCYVEGSVRVLDVTNAGKYRQLDRLRRICRQFLVKSGIGDLCDRDDKTPGTGRMRGADHFVPIPIGATAGFGKAHDPFRIEAEVALARAISTAIV